MNINKTAKDGELCIKVDGSLDTVTAPLLEKEAFGSLDGVTTLIFDFSDLEYISSAGLRILFGAQQQMEDKGEFIIRHPNEEVLEILDITGSLDILTIEQ